MDYDRAAKKIIRTNMIGRGRTRKRWVDSVEEDVKKLGVNSWKSVTEDRPK